MTCSWVRSKPFVAISGLLAAIFGVMSALGFMTAIGVPFIATIGSMPFFIIGECTYGNNYISFSEQGATGITCLQINKLILTNSSELDHSDLFSFSNYHIVIM